MIPDSIILLDANRRLDVLLDALEASRKELVDGGCLDEWDRAWERCTAAWEAVHGELMNQLKGQQ